MSFDDVLGQSRVKELLAAAIERGRLGHAYLFTGPDGVGKTLCALELAKAVLCRGKAPRPCDECPTCHMVDHDRHPDVVRVELMEKDGKLLQDISVEQIRDAITFLNLKPVQSERRIVIIREAELLNKSGANAFLKTLEEPAAFGLLVLTCSRPEMLPQTIRSRCQEVRFAPLAAEEVRHILSNQPDLEDAEIALAARFSGGSAGRALRMIETGCLQLYGPLIARVTALPKEDPFEVAGDVLDWAQAAGGKGLEPQRIRVRELLRLLGCAYRDLLALQVGAPEGLLFQAAPDARARDLAGRCSPARLLRIEEALWEARRQTDANAALGLVLACLFDRIGELQAA